MVATPAWPQSSLPRLFVDSQLTAGMTLTLQGPSAHYLANVLRLQAGAQIKLFDDRSGEWRADLTDAGKRSVSLNVAERLREREEVPDLWLLFAPIKRGRIDWLVEKATELGVRRLLPILTRRTIVDRLNLDRLRAHAIEAAEQCERTALPDLAAPEKLGAVLETWPMDRTLYLADEAGGTPFAEAVMPGPAAILIGPEGGWIEEEREAIRALDAARSVSLGPRILRADTAAIAAVTLWMARAGDWSVEPVR